MNLSLKWERVIRLFYGVNSYCYYKFQGGRIRELYWIKNNKNSFENNRYFYNFVPIK